MDTKEVAERVLLVLKGFEKVDPAKLSDKAHFSNDLGLDSLDAVEVSNAMYFVEKALKLSLCNIYHVTIFIFLHLFFYRFVWL